MVRVAITGASGNLGTSLVSALAAAPEVDEIVGIARRLPAWRPPKVRWVAADVARHDLTEAFRGADVVVHLAWLIQPSRDLAALHRVNVGGSQRVFAAAVAAGARAIVHTSSFGAYSPGPDASTASWPGSAAPAAGPGGTERVDESWPTDGVDQSFYSRHKAYAERMLDYVEQSNPALRVVRIRPSLAGKRQAATGLQRLFLGRVIPTAVLGRLPVSPAVAGLHLQFTHSDDIAAGFRLAILNETARGAYNLAAEPALSPLDLARHLGGRPVALPAAARAAAALSWRLRIQPTPPGWVDLALAIPLMDAGRARRELGWAPRHESHAALDDVLAGLRDHATGPTPPLER